MTLSQKPTTKKPALSWKELDQMLQNNFKAPTKNSTPSLEISLNLFDLTIEEVEKEATAKGYTVTILDNSLIRFT